MVVSSTKQVRVGLQVTHSQQQLLTSLPGALQESGVDSASVSGSLCLTAAAASDRACSMCTPPAFPGALQEVQLQALYRGASSTSFTLAETPVNPEKPVCAHLPSLCLQGVRVQCVWGRGRV